MITVENNSLRFSFTHLNGLFELQLIRTLRIPDQEGQVCPLPPNLGTFPVRHIDDYEGRVPKHWLGRGGILIPMYQSEAMWINFLPRNNPARKGFVRSGQFPVAVKIGTGKVSAITGKEWKDGLRKKDYCVAPPQPWIDGFVTKEGTVRQFIAEQLGNGLTAEEQITGKAEFGGLQIEAFPMKEKSFNNEFPEKERETSCLKGNLRMRSMDIRNESYESGFQSYCSATISTNDLDSLSRGVDDSIKDMGLAPGGQMEQQIFEDPYGKKKWDTDSGQRVFVHLVNSMMWKQITGEIPPHAPLTAADYTNKGYPWFKYWDDEVKSLKETRKTAGLKSVAQIEKLQGKSFLPENQPIGKPTVSHVVKDGKW